MGHPIADCVPLFDLEPYVLDGHINLQARSFHHESTTLEGCRVPEPQPVEHVPQCDAADNGPLEREHVSPFDRLQCVEYDSHFAGPPIRNRVEERAGAWDGKLPHEVRKKHDAPGECTYQRQLAAGIISADLLRELGNAGFDRLFRNEDGD